MFLQWQNRGLRTQQDLFIDGSFASFQQLRTKFPIPHAQFFRYLQLRDFIRKQLPHFPACPLSSDIDSLLAPVQSFKGIISSLYSALSSQRNVSLDTIKHRWEQDLGETILDETWDAILKRVHTSSICARHGLIQCKILHRAHWTKEKLSEKFPDIDPACNRCKMTPSSYIHTFWSCFKLTTYWT